MTSEYVPVFLRFYVGMYVCIHASSALRRMYLHMSVRTYVDMYWVLPGHCTYITSVHACTYDCLSVCMHACIVCVCVCVYVHMYACP